MFLFLIVTLTIIEYKIYFKLYNKAKTFTLIFGIMETHNDRSILSNSINEQRYLKEPDRDRLSVSGINKFQSDRNILNQEEMNPGPI